MRAIIIVMVLAIVFLSACNLSGEAKRVVETGLSPANEPDARAAVHTEEHYIYGANLEAKYDEDGLRYIHQDVLGSTRATTDTEGNKEGENTHLPYGQSLSSSQERFGFTGKENEGELTYFGARYYDSDIGKFTQKDPIKDNKNWYSYASNNPLKYIDPTGMYDIMTGLVETGDTLFEITEDLNEFYGTSYSYMDIAFFEQIENPDVISVGDTIRIGAIDMLGRVWQPPFDPEVVTSGYWGGLSYLQQQIMHYHRNVYQADADIPERESMLDMHEWKSKGVAIAHNLMGAEGNVDYRGKGPRYRQQAIYNPQGDLVTDPANMGTFDYYGPGVFTIKGHLDVDVAPWILWGNTPNDPTTIEMRLNTMPDILDWYLLNVLSGEHMRHRQ
ncbi:MAG: RHS repeat-associated core domain-containing protein [archaeon]